jgi:hypothetical protein
LAEHEVDYVIIGGVAAVLHGASLMTQDLDIVADFTYSNLTKLEAALKPFDPHHRITNRDFPFSLSGEADALRWRNLYLKTTAGVIDVLSDVKGIGDFAACLKVSEKFTVDGIPFQMLTIDSLIQAKSAVGRDKDLKAVSELEVIRAARNI